jgi:hypothetical protein
MTMQSNHHDKSFIHTAMGQTILLSAAVIAVIIIAWFYVW